MKSNGIQSDKFESQLKDFIKFGDQIEYIVKFVILGQLNEIESQLEDFIKMVTKLNTL